VFVSGPDKATTRLLVDDIRSRAVRHGRKAADIAVFLGCTVVVGSTRKDAEQKYHEYHRYASIEGALAHFSSSTGIDLSRYELDEPIRYEKNNANNSAVEAITTLSREPWTLKRIIGQMGLGSRNAPIIGSAEEVADELIARAEETGVDGFNLSRVVTPESLEDFVDLVIPALQERGAYKREYAAGSLREKLFGHARLPDTHPAALHRRPGQRARRPAAE
jgi:alkanesulfonate monooxygenase SsuD/methylene tetrahydromethanopterin reductase-like flavin-dependent oxidoreductase (luciferase family)